MIFLALTPIEILLAAICWRLWIGAMQSKRDAEMTRKAIERHMAAIQAEIVRAASELKPFRNAPVQPRAENGRFASMEAAQAYLERKAMQEGQK